MATSQNPHTPRRRPPVGDRSRTGAATPERDPTPENPTEHTSGHLNARGTLPMACHPPTTTITAPAHGEPRPDRPAPVPDEAPKPEPAPAPAPAGVSAADRALMRARLAAMAAPRDSDDEELAALCAILRGEALMAHVTANVERWPPLTDEQRES